VYICIPRPKQLIIADESDEVARGGGAAGGGRRNRSSRKTQPLQQGDTNKYRREIELKSITQITPREDNFQFEVTYLTRIQVPPKTHSSKLAGMGLRKPSSSMGFTGSRKSGRKSQVGAAAGMADVRLHSERVVDKNI
jgi:hypothetical protein